MTSPTGTATETSKLREPFSTDALERTLVIHNEMGERGEEFLSAFEGGCGSRGHRRSGSVGNALQ
jgi:hypothetical protein